MISGNTPEVNQLNAKSLEAIDSSIIIVSLDSTSPITREEVSWGCWVGDGVDRWFDKHQLIVFENGKSGFNGEVRYSQSYISNSSQLMVPPFFIALFNGRNTYRSIE
jgi:hypothetical protein